MIFVVIFCQTHWR